MCIERCKHGFGDQSRGVTLRLSSTTKSLRIFNSIHDNSKQSMRQLARHTGLSTSSVHRHTQAMARRDRHPESWLWETPEGRNWLIRLVVATLFMFGLKRGVGAETISEFFGRLHLETQVGWYLLNNMGHSYDVFQEAPRLRTFARSSMRSARAGI